LFQALFVALALLVWSPGQAWSQEVYRIHPLAEGTLVAAMALGELIPLAFADDLIRERCPCDPAEVDAFDRPVIGNQNPLANTASNWEVGAAILAPLALDAWDVGFSRAYAEDALVFGETLALNGALVTLAKYLYQRPLPRVYAGQDPTLEKEPGGYRSFYSGHTSFAVAALSAASFTENLRHGFSIWPWLGTAAVGSSVAWERVADGRHFYSDVIVGAVAGIACGVVVPWMHSTPGSLALRPMEDGVLMGWRGEF
jgi:membrane-associated phospholipid phosphatase